MSVCNHDVSDTYTYKHVAFPLIATQFYMVLSIFHHMCKVLFEYLQPA